MSLKYSNIEDDYKCKEDDMINSLLLGYYIQDIVQYLPDSDYILQYNNLKLNVDIYNRNSYLLDPKHKLLPTIDLTSNPIVNNPLKEEPKPEIDRFEVQRNTETPHSKNRKFLIYDYKNEQFLEIGFKTKREAKEYMKTCNFLNEKIRMP